jgi:hypothetical protein
MTSSILPNNQATVLPFLPTDGQRFVDAQMVQWIYDGQEGIWEKRGTTDDLPLATSSQAGLLSPQDKSLIDGIPAVGGGFGIITDAKLLLQSSTNPEGVVTGDIKLKSESLDITCISTNRVKLDCVIPDTVLECSYGESDAEETPGLQFKLSDKFLDSLIIDVRGPTGKTGFTGDKGAQGEPGLSAGPQGDQGAQGDNTDEICTLDEIRYKDIDGITDTPIVGLNLIDDDGHGCKLIVTKAKINTEDGRPADKVITTSLSRSVIYGADPNPSEPPEPEDPEDPTDPTDPPVILPRAFSDSSCSYTRLDDWSLAKPAGDPSPLNLQLLRLSKGSNEVIDNPVGFNGTMTLEGFVGEIVAEYKDRLEKVDEQWGKQVREYINSLDDKARGILSGLANDLAMCEFDLPATEYCITFVGCESTYFSSKLQAESANPVELSGTKVTKIDTKGNRDWNVKL